MIKPRKPKNPRKWQSKDAKCCIECDKEFRRGDQIYTDGVISIHVGCKEAYVKSCKELGIKP